MKQQNKSYLSDIRGLLIPSHINRDLVAAAIEEYITIIPELTESLTDNLNNGRASHFVRNAMTARSMLSSVCARWLLTDADAILSAANRGHFDLCKKMLPGFVSDMLSLSIEMQMAEARADKDMQANQSLIEVYADMVNNLNAIGKLAARTEFDLAFDMLSDLNDPKEGQLGNSDMGIELINALLQKNGAKAGSAASTLKELYIAKIKKLGGDWSNVPGKILAVDDRPDVLASVSRILKERYKVFCAPGGDAALRLLTIQKPDLFIFDIDMPGMNGFELAHAIRAMDGHASTPLLFLTSNASRESVLKAMSAGGNDFIVKPANHSMLLAKVGKYI